jgi:hypothetical protein
MSNEQCKWTVKSTAVELKVFSETFLSSAAIQGEFSTFQLQSAVQHLTQGSKLSHLTVTALPYCRDTVKQFGSWASSRLILFLFL